MIVPALFFTFASLGCDESVKAAASALQQNNLAQAAAILESVRPSCTQSASFYELSGTVSEFSGKAAAAEDAFKKAVALDPQSSRLLTGLGISYLRHKKLVEARTTLEKALRAGSPDPRAAKYLIGTYVELRDFPKALALTEQIGAEKNSELFRDPIAVLWFAQTLIESGQTARLTKFLDSRKSELSVPLLFSLGTVFARQEMYQEAVTYFERIPDRDADDAVYFNLGLAYSHLRQFDRARQYYFQAIDRKSGHIDAYFRVGLDYAGAGDLTKAVPWLFRAKELSQGRPDIVYALGEQLLQLNYTKTAEELITASLRTSPNDPFLMAARADVDQQRGRLDDARAKYQEVLAHQPRFAPALVGLAKIAVSQGKDEEARVYLQKSLALEQKNAAANGQLGLLEARQKQWAKALPYLNRAWSENHSNMAIGLELARALRSSGRPADALQVLAPMQPVMQSSPPFHLELSQIYAQLHQTSEAQKERETFTRLEAQSHDALRFEDPQVYVQ
jgi:tetratricopeptide (TPR) repeat protein